jgi:hypothetical protein
MAAISTDFSSIIQQMQSLESSLSSSSLAQDPTIGGFVSALDSVLAAGKKVLAANSAGVSDAGSGPANLAGYQGGDLSTGSESPPAASPVNVASAPAVVTSSAVGTPHILAPGSSPDSSKPNIAQFTLLTGCDFATAAEVLYGTVGSNVDLRDWSAIMASSSPLADAKASTAALYNSSLDFTSPDASAPAADDLLGRSGNFEYSLEQVDPAPVPKTPVLFLCDGAGNRLRAADNPQQLADSAKSFGFDTSALAALQAQLEAAGINYRTGAWSNGFLGAG